MRRNQKQDKNRATSQRRTYALGKIVTIITVVIICCIGMVRHTFETVITNLMLSLLFCVRSFVFVHRSCIIQRAILFCATRFTCIVAFMIVGCRQQQLMIVVLNKFWSKFYHHLPSITSFDVSVLLLRSRCVRLVVLIIECNSHRNQNNTSFARSIHNL